MHKDSLAEGMAIPDHMDCCYDPGNFKFQISRTKNKMLFLLITIDLGLASVARLAFDFWANGCIYYSY